MFISLSSGKGEDYAMAKSKKPSVRTKASARGNQLSSITNSLVDAAVEIGRAAENLKSSIEHAQKAGKSGNKAIAPIRKMGEKAVRKVRKTISRKRR